MIMDFDNHKSESITNMKRFVLICFALLIGVLCISCSDNDEEITNGSAPVLEPVFLSYGEFYGSDIEYGKHNEPAEVVVIKSEKELRKYQGGFLPFDDPALHESFDFNNSSLLLILGLHSSSLGALREHVTKQGRKYHIDIVFEHSGVVFWAFTPWYIAYKVPKNAKANSFIVDVTTEWKETEDDAY